MRNNKQCINNNRTAALEWTVFDIGYVFAKREKCLARIEALKFLTYAVHLHRETIQSN